MAGIARFACLAIVAGLVGACGGEDLEEMGDESGVDTVEQAALYPAGAFRLKHNQTNTCVQDIGGGNLGLRACSNAASQRLSIYLDTGKCTGYRYIGSYPYCVAWASQYRIGSKCIRANRVPPRGVLDPAVLGACGDNLSYWGTSKSRMFNYRTVSFSTKLWLTGASGRVKVKRARNPYDESATAWTAKPW